MVQKLYADGGLIGRDNPSYYGGTWAWVLTEDDDAIERNHGIVQPIDISLDAVSNNNAELIAAIEALEAMPRGWNGFLCTDSQVTGYRLTGETKMIGVPDTLCERLDRIKHRHRWKVIQMAGHPTRSELNQGIRKRNGLPVSLWNVACDVRCSKMAREFLQRLNGVYQ